jgi:RNA polymerase sigma-70 factor, ECF subfamily
VVVQRRLDAEPASKGFETFFREGYGRLLRALYLVTGDVEEARELTQEAYLRIWERWDRVGIMDNAEGYLYRTAMNLWRSRLRRTARAAKRVVGIEAARDPFAGADDHDMVVRALRTLTPRQRAAIVLTELLDVPSDEAGAAMGVGASTVRALATQGRAVLRERLDPSDG